MDYKLPALALMLAACAAPRGGAGPSAPQNAFWANLSALCGKAFDGRIAAKVGGGPGPDPFDGKVLTMHVRECSDGEIRVPFHVGSDRGRTWVFSRTARGLRLKHDHRHEDGRPEEVTLYGGDTADPGTPEAQSFHADAQSKWMFIRAGIPKSADNVWVVRLLPGKTFSYALTRPGREFRLEFDLSAPVEPPGPPWGAK